MKKLLCCLAALCLLVSSAAFAEGTLRIGVMSGPTGMGMAALMQSGNEAYTFEIYSAPTDATADLASGALDLLCLPTNTAAMLASRKADFISVAAINCLGSLYLLTDGTVEISTVADLEGMTIVAGVPSSTTGPILQHILDANGVNATIEWEADHDAVAARMLTGDVHIAVLPEPKATVVMSQSESFGIVFSISEAWDAVTDTRLPMGCIVVRNDVLREQPELVEAFLADYSESIAFIGDPANHEASAEMIAAAGILPKAGIAKKALVNLYGAIVYEDGEQMRTDLQAFYAVIGLDQPDDAFYYLH